MTPLRVVDGNGERGTGVESSQRKQSVIPAAFTVDAVGPAEQSTPIRVAVLDNHEVITVGVTAMLESDSRFVVVAAATSHTALVAINEDYDVVVLDLYLTGEPSEGGSPDFDILEALCATHAVLVMSVSGADEDIFDVVNEFPSVGGYIKKGFSAETLCDAVATVAAGGRLMSAELAGVFWRERQRRGDLKDLAPREEQVLQLLADALTYGQIAQILAISAHTVSETIDRIRDKWRLPNRSRQALVNKGQELGYLQPPQRRRRRRREGA